MIRKNERKAVLLQFVIIFLLAFAARSWADPVVCFRTENPDVIAGQTISVEIFATVTTSHVRIDRISDDAGGLAGNLWLNPDYREPLDLGTIVNFDNVLIEEISSYITSISPEVTGVLYNFDYTVPLVATGTQIDIFCDSSEGAINYVWCDGLDPVTPENLTINVVPEPSSFLLLSLSMLLLRCYRKR